MRALFKVSSVFTLWKADHNLWQRKVTSATQIKLCPVLAARVSGAQKVQKINKIKVICNSPLMIEIMHVQLRKLFVHAATDKRFPKVDFSQRRKNKIYI